MWGRVRAKAQLSARAEAPLFHVSARFPVSARFHVSADFPISAALRSQRTLHLDVATGLAALFQILLVIILSGMKGDRRNDLGDDRLGVAV
jgi:hypothetical protein